MTPGIRQEKVTLHFRGQITCEASLGDALSVRAAAEATGCDWLNAGPVLFGLNAGPVPVSIFCFLIRDMHAHDQDVDLIRIFIPRPTLVLFFLFFGPRH